MYVNNCEPKSLSTQVFKDACCKIIPPWGKNSRKKPLKVQNYRDISPHDESM